VAGNFFNENQQEIMFRMFFKGEEKETLSRRLSFKKNIFTSSKKISFLFLISLEIFLLEIFFPTKVNLACL